MPARSRAFTRASSTETGAAERAPAADSRPAGGIQSEAGGSGSLPPAEAATRRAAEAAWAEGKGATEVEWGGEAIEEGRAALEGVRVAAAVGQLKERTAATNATGANA